LPVIHFVISDQVSGFSNSNRRPNKGGDSEY